MILADSSIWIDHFRAANAVLEDALRHGRIACHPMVIGEIAMGSLNNRTVILKMLARLQDLRAARDAEVLGMVDDHRLYSLGLGYIDAHLLASTLINPGCRLWTRDKRLEKVAMKLGIAVALTH